MKTAADRRKSDRERKNLWRQKNIEKGFRPVQVMMSPEAQKALDREKGRTGENITDIVNRAILLLDAASSAGPMGAASSRKAENDAIKNRVIQMDRDGTPHMRIAKILNSEGVPTLSGRGKWYQGTVGKLLQQERNKYRT